MFKLESKFKPAGDQPKGIRELTDGLEKGHRYQTLLGVTGSGKTFTAAHVIAAAQKPALVIAHNKTLAAQLTNEFRALFPKNSVHYFVSYYDYYQPEAYMPSSDTYIEKEAMINEEIDRLRHAATAALLTRRDVIVVASVSCIYGLGAPEVYRENIFHLKKGAAIDRVSFSRKLIELHYTRTTSDLKRGTFRIRGEQWEIMPPDRELIYALEVKPARNAPATTSKMLAGAGREGVIEKVYEVDPVRGFVPGETAEVPEVVIAPAKHFITPKEERERAIKAIREELKIQLKKFEKEGKLLEAERLERRTKFDLAMIREVGYCHGIENYSRHLSGRAAGEPPDTLLDYFPRRNPPEVGTSGRDSGGPASMQSSGLGEPDFVTIIDESHVTVPQIAGMYEGDAARKKTLIEYGFRLPSAADNRPLRFAEFEKRVGQIIFTSATPGPFEKKVSTQTVEQIIRPTGLVDPKVTLLPARGQVADLIPRIEERAKQKERVLVTTLTKKMAEDLASYLETRQIEGGERSRTTEDKKFTLRPIRRTQGANKQPIKVAYLHSDVKTMDRIRILTNLRKGTYDVLVGVNLLREGLDLPEVSLVAILDADKEGFLRSETSLVQTIGRAARHIRGEVLLYADVKTGSLARAIGETERRRTLQLAYNKAHGITPRSVEKEIRDILPADAEAILKLEAKPVPKSGKAREALIEEKKRAMKEAAEELNFELAAILRDEIRILSQREAKVIKSSPKVRRASHK